MRWLYRTIRCRAVRGDVEEEGGVLHVQHVLRK
jgi:hypothetical protein